MTEPTFADYYYEDKYRDLWDRNMPRVSGCIYLAIPGEQPIHLDDEDALFFMSYLSERERGLR